MQIKFSLLLLLLGSGGLLHSMEEIPEKKQRELLIRLHHLYAPVFMEAYMTAQEVPTLHIRMTEYNPKNKQVVKTEEYNIENEKKYIFKTQPENTECLLVLLYSHLLFWHGTKFKQKLTPGSSYMHNEYGDIVSKKDPNEYNKEHNTLLLCNKPCEPYPYEWSTANFFIYKHEELNQKFREEFIRRRKETESPYRESTYLDYNNIPYQIGATLGWQNRAGENIYLEPINYTYSQCLHDEECKKAFFKGFLPTYWLQGFKDMWALLTKNITFEDPHLKLPSGKPEKVKVHVKDLYSLSQIRPFLQLLLTDKPLTMSMQEYKSRFYGFMTFTGTTSLLVGSSLLCKYLMKK